MWDQLHIDPDNRVDDYMSAYFRVNAWRIPYEAATMPEPSMPAREPNSTPPHDPPVSPGRPESPPMHPPPSPRPATPHDPPMSPPVQPPRPTGWAKSTRRHTDLIKDDRRRLGLRKRVTADPVE